MATGTITNNIDLLWTNPSPTASFVGQDIYLDLTKYSAIEVFVKGELAGNSARCAIGGDSQIVWVGGASTNTAYGTISNSRSISTTTSKVHITDNRQVYTGAASAVVNSYNIPYKIYGYK